MTARYALYYAPRPGEALAVAGRQWLGRDAETGQARALPAVPGLDPERLAERVAAPRHYGLHATLKPPLALADGSTEAELLAAVGRWAAMRRPFATPPLALAALGGFLALVVRPPSAELQALADDCVTAFDVFRRTASPVELADRRAAGLSPRQDALLCRWGYPYVLDQWRFHVTLTGMVADAAERSILERAIEGHFAAVLGQPLAVRDVCLFRQPDRSRPFTLQARFALGGGRRVSTQAWSAP